jgi:beta-ureidopropionase / N-carbamoyl-L-amino-acid hydrolase
MGMMHVMTNLSINPERLITRLRELGEIGRTSDRKLIRLAASDADGLGRDKFVEWASSAGLDVRIDRIGNIFALWTDRANAHEAPIMLGSHIDTVIDAGIYDGSYGVIAGLEVVETLKSAGFLPKQPIVVAAFTNEEGVRYAPDMMGSLVYAGGLAADRALDIIGTDGSRLGVELERIGYAGREEPGFLKPAAYLELHIEQGPVLERDGISIGAVENLQGISWQRIIVEGIANHAGTTPMAMRHDAGYAAAMIMAFLHDRATLSQSGTVATIGCISFEPNAINVIPAKATFTLDLRDPDEQRLQAEEQVLAEELKRLAAREGLTVTAERLARFEPVIFDRVLVERIEAAAAARGLTSRRMTSGAGHDAQMISRIAPAAIIFVPSMGGISHNPKEFTPEADLVAGANILLDVVKRLTT